MLGIGSGAYWEWWVLGMMGIGYGWFFYSGFFGWWVLDMLIWYWVLVGMLGNGVWWVCWEMGFGVYWMGIWFRKGNGKVGHLIRMVGNFGRVG